MDASGSSGREIDGAGAEMGGADFCNEADGTAADGTAADGSAAEEGAGAEDIGAAMFAPDRAEEPGDSGKGAGPGDRVGAISIREGAAEDDTIGADSDAAGAGVDGVNAAGSGCLR